ncbi:Flp family type IVb pilin [Undibacterium arcticum]|uniref:Flp family type IVb pilin n=1 Tax=Undibacterium arcticum TaxID=1762892 RepID=A0ABV7F347_9BURK
MNAIKKFMQDEEGAVAVEYALLGALIALTGAAGATVLGKDLCGVFQGLATAVATNIYTLPPSFTPCT